MSFEQRGRLIEAVRGVSFEMGREKLGIVGESGSGKSQSGRAILGLSEGKVEAEAMRFRDLDLLTLGRRARRDLRGGGIGMVMQDPKYSLNPVMRIGRQLVEALRAHEKVISDVRRSAPRA